MKQFMAIYVGTPEGRIASGWDELDTKDRSDREDAGMTAWGKWMGDHADAIVVMGGPLGKTQRIDRSGVSATVNNLTGYVVVQAESHAAATKMFEDHPHFSIFPGEAVEVIECLPIPGG